MENDNFSLVHLTYEQRIFIEAIIGNFLYDDYDVSFIPHENDKEIFESILNAFKNHK